jgi:hypothetical protein
MQKKCIAVIRRRLCAIAQRRAIMLTFFIEATVSRRPGGIMVSVFI